MLLIYLLHRKKGITPLKILIVDDNQRVRKMIRKFLEKLPYSLSITECSDGKEAVVIHKEENPDVILMDIMMEKMDGIEAIRQIKTSQSKVKIIVVSQLPEQEYKQEAINAGANDYLNKEDLSQLPAIIERLTRHKNKL